MNTSSNLKKLMKMLKMTQMGFAGNINVNRSTLTRYINGERKPDLKTCRKIILLANRHGIKINLEFIRPDLGIEFN